jgi:hypothetical protein
MRKVLSFVLVLTLVLSSFSMAFAADTKAVSLSDIAGNANEDAIQVAYDLGIVTGNPDGTFAPDKAVNRAEFAAMITRALNIPDSALAGYTTTTFKDTVGYGWAVPYLAFCQSKGIMLGDGQGNVMPGRTITVNEAMTMALRAIGYTANSSLLVGVWPSNYVSIAQNNDLYDDVAKETTVNKASAAQIIYNLLTVQKVAVNTDGTTDYLWKDRDDEVEANLLNTNLGCTEYEDVVLGVDYDYDDAIINITGKIGAYGTAYLNSDDELVAFTVESTALTGKVDGSNFEVGDTDYDFGANSFTSASSIRNTSVVTDSSLTIDDDMIVAFAADNTNDGDTVTLNVELSGKKIKDIYSVVAWEADQADKAASDVQEDIEDATLLAEDFVTDDDDEIDMKSFELVGVTSLSKIAEDNVVYVYVDNSSDIRKIEVGTETVEGIVEETDSDTATIDGKDYDLAALAVVDIPTDIDVDSEGTFFLDVNGDIFDFDGTGSVDTFGVVKAYAGETSFDNFKIKLYMSDDSTDTLYFADDAEDIDWVSDAATTVDAIVTGALIGYSLDSNGDIDTVDNTAFDANNVTFQSAKVLKIGTTSYSIDSNAVVFTYKGDNTATADYDVASLSEVEKGTIATVASPASIILNSDNKVVAMFIDEYYVDVEDDDVYGVFNARTSTKNGDDNVYKFTGFIDGAAFTKKTDDRSTEYNDLAGVFGVYRITVDANDIITAVAAITETDPLGAEDSGIVAADKVITDLNSDRTVITTASGKYTIADDAVVYKYDEDDEEFSVAKLSNLRKNYTVSLYDTKGEDADGIASVVIYKED